MEWKALLGGAIPVIVIALSLFIRRFILKHIDEAVRCKHEKDLETHKAALKNQYDLQIECLRADVKQSQIRFSHVFEKTADAITTVYGKVLDLQKSVAEYGKTTSILPTHNVEARLFRQIIEAADQFDLVYCQQKIFIPKRTRRKIAAFKHDLSNLTNRVRSLTQNQPHQQSPSDIIAGHKQADLLVKHAGTLLDNLIDDFQKDLGFPEEAAPQSADD